MSELDLSLYRKYNDDLAGLSEEALKRHYESYGQVEERIRNSADVAKAMAHFDVNAYRRLNSDIAGLDNEALTEHWLKYGWREKRQASQDPDYRLAPEEHSYVKKVDYRRVTKNMQEVFERLSNYKGKLEAKTKEGMVKFIDEVLTKTDAKLNPESRRYIFGIAWKALVDMLFTSGEITQDEHIQWVEIVQTSPKIIDK